MVEEPLVVEVVGKPCIVCALEKTEHALATLAFQHLGRYGAACHFRETLVLGLRAMPLCHRHLRQEHYATTAYSSAPVVTGHDLRDHATWLRNGPGDSWIGHAVYAHHVVAAALGASRLQYVACAVWHLKTVEAETSVITGNGLAGHASTV